MIKEVKLSLFLDDTMLYIENLRSPSTKLLKLANFVLVYTLDVDLSDGPGIHRREIEL